MSLRLCSPVSATLRTSNTIFFLSHVQHNKCATYSVGMQKTYSMICLAIDDDDKTDKTKKISKKLSFLSWGTNKNRQKSASTLCLPSVGVARPQVKKKLPSPFSLLNSDSSLYWCEETKNVQAPDVSGADQAFIFVPRWKISKYSQIPFSHWVNSQLVDLHEWQ